MVSSTTTRIGWNGVIARKEWKPDSASCSRLPAAGAAIPGANWTDPPPATRGHRPTLAAGWNADNDAVNGLPNFLNTLRAGNLAIVPLTADATPIRILLGDFLANAGIISRDRLSTHSGVRVEVVLQHPHFHRDFMLSDTSATGSGWAPMVGTW